MAQKKDGVNTTPIGVDEEYKDAIQPVVDDRMRTDVLGPHFCKVIEDHKPAGDKVVGLVKEAVRANPDLRTEIKGVVSEFNKDSKIRWIDRILGAVGTIVLALVIWGVQYIATHTPAV